MRLTNALLFSISISISKLNVFNFHVVPNNFIKELRVKLFYFNIDCIKEFIGPCEMAQWVTVGVVKPDDLT